MRSGSFVRFFDLVKPVPWPESLRANGHSKNLRVQIQFARVVKTTCYRVSNRAVDLGAAILCLAVLVLTLVEMSTVVLLPIRNFGEL